MSDPLQTALRHLDLAVETRRRGERSAARTHYLRAARCMLRAAAGSTGQARGPRLRKAGELLDRARRLSSAAPRAGEDAEQSAPRPVRERGAVRFDDVVGLERAKQEIRLRLIYPLQHPEKAARYGIRRGGGILLYGPPGTGKTLLARAVAGEIDAPFFTASPSTIMSRWVGEAEQNVARLFARARRHERAVIFLDEVEALLPARALSTSDVMRRVVPQMLAEMQGFTRGEGALLFLAATNAPWALDPAALRPGRLDVRVHVGLPDRDARRAMLRLNLQKRPVGPDVNLDVLAEKTGRCSGADLADLCERAAAAVFIESIRRGVTRRIRMGDLLSMLAEMRPSVSARSAEAYERWNQKAGSWFENAAASR